MSLPTAQQSMAEIRSQLQLMTDVLDSCYRVLKDIHKELKPTFTAGPPVGDSSLIFKESADKELQPVEPQVDNSSSSTEPPARPGDPIRLEILVGLFKQGVADGHSDALRALLDEYGVDKLKDLKAIHYGKVAKQVGAIVGIA